MADLCTRLGNRLRFPPRGFECAVLRVLARRLADHDGDLVRPLVDLYRRAALTSESPWPFVRALLHARDPDIATDGLGLTERLADAGRLREAAARALSTLAVLVTREGTSLAAPDAKIAIGRIWRRLSGDEAPAEARRRPTVPLRRLAARVLDAEGVEAIPAARSLAEPAAFAFLEPYLEYTRATHEDVADLLPVPGGTPPSLASLREAERLLSPTGLRALLAEVGWSRVSRGVEVFPQVALSFAGSFPVLFSPTEAELLGRGDDVRAVADPILVVAHGGAPGASRASLRGTERIARFRAYCLRHADALQDFLDAGPLPPSRAERVVARSDDLVAEHLALFREHGEECRLLPEVYATLRSAIRTRLAVALADAPLDPETTRLVVSFEDPTTVGEIRTLHGLKRFLHQRALRLAARLLADPAATDRTVDLLVFEKGRLAGRVPTIRWSDLDPAPRAGGAVVPAAVAAVVTAFAHQLLQGHREFPAARVFVYGSESHAYLSWWGHPAFLRVDRSPPLRGGLVDLEFFGVSKSHGASHPAPELPAVRRFLEAMDFDVEIEATHVRARYDKERAVEAEEVAEKAADLLALAPYLMDLDWVSGSLQLPPEAKERVNAAWQRTFALRGVLPWKRILTDDRTGISLGAGEGPAAPREEAWSGQGEVPERYPDAPSPARLAQWATALRSLGLEEAARRCASLRSLGQREVDRVVLRPLREARARGELRDDRGRFRHAGDLLFRPIHEAELFAAMLGSAAATASGVRAAHLAVSLERALRFTTSGRVQGCEVQRARCPLADAVAGLFVLRDEEGILRLAIFARAPEACARRDAPDEPWQVNLFDDPAEVAVLARRAGLLDETGLPPEGSVAAQAARIREELRSVRALPGPDSPRHVPVVEARRLGAGRAAGRATLASHDVVSDPEGGVLVLARLGPRDFARLGRAAAVVATGGSVLSHAGLVLGQQAKPAVIVSGVWDTEGEGHPVLRLPCAEHRNEERVIRGMLASIRRDLSRGEMTIRDGDLLVVDAEAGHLEGLGSEPGTLALHADLVLLRKDALDLAAAVDPRDILVRRGRLLRTVRRLRVAIESLRDPGLAEFVAHEFVAGGSIPPEGLAAEAQRALLRALLANEAVGDAARERLDRVAREVVRSEAQARVRATEWLRDADSTAEVVALRLDVIHRREVADAARRALADAGLAALPEPAGGGPDALDRAASAALHRIRRRLVGATSERGIPGAMEGADRERLDALLRVSPPRARATAGAAARRRDADRAQCAGLAERLVLEARDGGAALAPWIGPKAANLGEIQRVLGDDAVPAWFAVTDRALRRMLAVPDGDGGTLGDALAREVARRDRDPGERSAAIGRLFADTPLPDDVAEALACAYARLAAPGESGEPCVAVRSSAAEEDLLEDARAGEFETFLGVRGGRDLECRVRRAWAGFWTERAIRRRDELGLPPLGSGGGILVQRLVDARVSGVVLTRGPRGAAPREMLVEAGLGLGEGVVSGAVPADEIHVVREPGSAGLRRFRYIPHEKTEQVILDRGGRLGTVRVPTKSHQRMRPALEWVELDELVRAAERLETAWRWPLDLEFAFEDDRLRLLQARPLPSFFAAYRRTIERFPLGGARVSRRPEETSS